MSKLRVAIIGLGVMGTSHARVLSTLDGVDLVAVVDPNCSVQNLPQNIKILKNLEELVRLEVDYCVVAAPTESHEKIALSLIEKGVHFLVEKPLAHSYSSAMKIKEAVSKSNVKAAVGHVERFNSALQEARKRILAGELGAIYQIATRRQGPFPFRIADVGVVMDLATHDIDLSSWISGKSYTQVSSNAVFRSGREYEDLISINGLIDDSIVVSHLVNWLSPLKERKVIITGEKGTFVVDTLRSDLIFYENGKFKVSQYGLAHFQGVTQGNVISLAFDKPEPLFVENQQFRDAVLGIDSQIVTLEEGITTVKVAESIIESYRTKKTILI